MTTTIIGIDAEWQTQGDSNLVLSYQWYGIDDNDSWSGIHYPELNGNQNRLKLRQWVSLTLQDHYKGRSWPTEIVLVSHFSPAELSVVGDFGSIKNSVDLVQGTSFATITRPLDLRCYDTNRNQHTVRVHIADTMLLAPDGGKKLENLGEILGLAKLDLPEGYEKDQMLKLLQEQPEAFERYAIRDAEIAAKYLQRIQEQCRDVGQTDRYRPITVGGLAVKIFIERLRLEGRTYDDLMGVTRRRETTGPRRTTATRSYRNELATRHEDLAVRCYHGGRNECFLFGPYNDETFTDYDLEGAYSTALAAVIEPDFDAIKETTDLDEFRLDQMGYALARWKFPDNTKFPCLFVRDENGHGLIYVLEGEGYVTSPEIDLARRMGAELEIVSGVVIPAKENGTRPFFSISQWVNQQRKTFNKKDHPFENSFYKLIGNNIYGKVAQGLKDKSRVFDTRTGNARQLERSAISDAYAAAYVTGLVRATTSEILSRLPNHVLVGNTITDGVCTTATDEEMETATSGPQCRFFADLRRSITGSDNIIEKKGSTKGMVFMRTRMHASLEPLGDGKPILAKVNMPMGHLQTDEGEGLDDQEKNDVLIREFAAREWDSEWTSRSLKTARKLWDTEGDLLSDEKVQYIGMDYDLKRRPINPTSRPINGYSKVEHLAFETRPWRTYEEYQKARKFLDGFKEPLKLRGDFDVLMQGVDTYGDKKRRSSQKRRLKVFSDDIRDRAAIGDDGIHHADGTRLKPREVDQLIKDISKSEFSVTGEQMRQTRKRLNNSSKILSEGYIEVTTSVSSADVLMRERFPGYTGKALKNRIRLVGDSEDV
jgi:hypothetical protein